MPTVIDVTSTIGCVAIAAYLAILSAKVVWAGWYASPADDPTRAIDGAGCAAVTVLQPVLGGDPSLESTLASNLLVTPPNATFLWLVDDDDTGAIAVVSALAATAPERVRIVSCPAAPPAVNPKTWKLHLGLAHVTTPLLAILDDDTSLSTDSLPIAGADTPPGGLFTGLPRYCPSESMWSSILAHFVNNNSVLTYLPMAWLAEPVTINGMFVVVRTDTLRGIGGFEPMLPMLCDDYALARGVRAAGGTIRQSSIPVAVRTTVLSGRHYASIMHRWMLFAMILLRDQNLPRSAAIIVLMGLPPFLLWGGLLTLGGPLWMLLVWPGAVVIRHSMLRFVQRRHFGTTEGFRMSHSLAAELLQPFHLAHALCSRTIRWRTRLIRARLDGTFEIMSSETP